MSEKKTGRIRSFADEFKAFIAKGNVVDMAVAVVIGGAFGKIVTSLVNDIIMPLIGKIVGGLNVSEWKWVLTEAVTDASGAAVSPEVAVTYGIFLQTVIDFLLIALSIFIMLKIILGAKEKLHKKKAVEQIKEEPKPSEYDVLCEIRDALREKKD